MKAVNGKSGQPLKQLSTRSPMDLTQRDSGLLLHVSSLPGDFGIGDLGPSSIRWIDMLARAGQRWWQMLPLGPVGEGNSPYRCYSAFAGNPLLISPQWLFEEGLLSKPELLASRLPAGRVNYRRVHQSKQRMLSSAFNRAKSSSDRQREFAGKRSWLSDYALFMALHDESPGVCFTQWERSLLKRQPRAMESANSRLAERIGFHTFIQFIFFNQLNRVRDHARSAGVAIIGDLPIFISPDSADVWTQPHLFQLDRYLQPAAVSGVPPDLFSATGQRWGNPLYNWKQMASDGFFWWKARIASSLDQADVVRIDHFRGFEAYWKIPASAPTAQTGKWVKAPGEQLFKALLAEGSHLALIAEDLGIITPAVELLRDRFNLPGMRVLQFGFGAESGNPHAPHNFNRQCFAYTGTHDNDTTAGWYRALSPAEKSRVKTYAPDLDWHHDPACSMIRLLLASVANHAIIPVQDLLGLNSSARMNRPGKTNRNWEWRLESFSQCDVPLVRLAEMTATYER